MMKSIKLVIIACLIMFAGTVSAQSKVGHINSAELLSLMPEAKAAETNLENYTKQLDNQYKGMVERFQSEYQSTQKQIQEGLLTPVQVAEKEKYFGTEQEKIGRFELEAQQKIAKKREELLGPILKRAQTAIENVAQEGGYTYIFDTSMGSILFAVPSDDIMGSVKSKLGM